MPEECAEPIHRARPAARSANRLAEIRSDAIQYVQCLLPSLSFPTRVKSYGSVAAHLVDDVAAPRSAGDKTLVPLLSRKRLQRERLEVLWQKKSIKGA